MSQYPVSIIQNFEKKKKRKYFFFKKRYLSIKENKKFKIISNERNFRSNFKKI